MLILEVKNIKKYFGDRLIISLDHLMIYSGDKIGIVGQNGAGKTTLMDILAGELSPDDGIVKNYCETAYIKQFCDKYEKDYSKLVEDGFQIHQFGDKFEIALVEKDLLPDTKLLKEFGVQDKINSEVLSGGEQTRLKIADALRKNSLLVFADEPTANLDNTGIQALKDKLSRVETLILISHDRDLLDMFCNKIIEVVDGSLSIYEGNYSAYQAQKRMETERQWSEYDRYISQKKGLEEAIVNRKARAKSIKKTPSRMGNSEARLHKREATERQKKLHNAANSLKTRLEKIEIKDRPKEQSCIKLDFSLTNPPQNKIVIASEDFSFSYPNQRIFQNVKFSVANGSKVAIMGDNGTGKSTLLNQIYDTFIIGNSALEEQKTKNKIHIVPKATLGYFYQDFRNLDFDKTILENLMRDSVQNETTVRIILARLLICGDDVYKKVNVLSGGERIKVSFAKLFVSNANVLLLDEPTNYLDIQSIQALENILCEYEGTVIFVSHDRRFVDKVSDKLLILKDKKILESSSKYDMLNTDKPSKKPANKASNELLVKSTDIGIMDKAQKQLDSTQKLIVQMRIAEVLAKMNRQDADKDALEQEYQSLISQISQ